jgi:hypothetical protein
LKDSYPHWKKVQQEIENKIGKDQISVLMDILNKI